MALHNIRRSVCACLQSADIYPDSIEGLSHSLSETGPNGALFTGIDTHYLQMKYYQQHFQFIVSIATMQVVIAITHSFRNLLVLCWVRKGRQKGLV